MRSPSFAPPANTDPMNRLPLSLPFALAALVLTPGCVGPLKPKPTPKIAEETESSFKHRWVAQRMAQLQASGEAPDARKAREVATREFAEKYEFTSAGRASGSPD
jgi:hypothetical protein